MMLYEILIGADFEGSKVGFIWCSDGSFVRPDKFSNKLGKTARCYVLSKGKAVSIMRSVTKFSWAPLYSVLYYYDAYDKSSFSDGVANSKAIMGHERASETGSPAAYASCSQSIDGVTSYMPAVEELKELYQSIMSGRMKENLITAGLYEKCNYRMNDNGIDGWSEIWSSTEYSPHGSLSSLAMFVNELGIRHYSYSGKNKARYVIPFFNI